MLPHSSVPPWRLLQFPLIPTCQNRPHLFPFGASAARSSQMARMPKTRFSCGFDELIKHSSHSSRKGTRSMILSGIENSLSYLSLCGAHKWRFKVLLGYQSSYFWTILCLLYVGFVFVTDRIQIGRVNWINNLAMGNRCRQNRKSIGQSNGSITLLELN